MSVVFAQLRAIELPGEKVKDLGAFGATRRYSVRNDALNCDKSLNLETVVREGNILQLTTYIKNHHKLILSKVNEKGYYNYDLYPHHIWSNAFDFDEFKALDKRTIGRYNLVQEVSCAEFIDGNIKRNYITQSEYQIDV